jgi:hypothetical protein
MRRTSSLFLIAAVSVFVAACAAGTESTGDNSGDDTSPAPDASDDPLPIDAPMPIDAAPPIDSSIPIDAPLPIDAPTGGDAGLFCTTTAQCTESGTCCFTLEPGTPGFCVPGTDIGGVCLPI